MATNIHYSKGIKTVIAMKLSSKLNCVNQVITCFDDEICTHFPCFVCISSKPLISPGTATARPPYKTVQLQLHIKAKCHSTAKQALLREPIKISILKQSILEIVPKINRFITTWANDFLPTNMSRAAPAGATNWKSTVSSSSGFACDTE